MQKEIEIWKDVVGYEEYFKVSNLGRILGKRSGKILKGSINGSGYIAIHSRIGSRSGPILRFLVHRAVAQAFIQEPKELQYLKVDTFYGIIPVNHKDGNKLNNYLDNLEWCAYSENTKHAIDMGLSIYKSGLENSNFKLSKDQVEYVQKNYEPRHKEFGARALGRKFQVSHDVILRCLKIDLN